ncbi:unnamed protein product [Thlaspi arvense]|uniref:Uncharacterized protein n=1 Tax=Thlaspi arvense TaxID=13288 RepID=A0AAU9S8R0_THLAR|nr:unnamed protein product [Thlaspi arvense]
MVLHPRASNLDPMASVEEQKPPYLPTAKYSVTKEFTISKTGFQRMDGYGRLFTLYPNCSKTTRLIFQSNKSWRKFSNQKRINLKGKMEKATSNMDEIQLRWIFYKFRYMFASWMGYTK